MSSDKSGRHCQSQAIEKEVLRRMVQNFRVQELQQLMTMCNRSKVGRKQELLARALFLVKNSNDVSKDCKVASSIRELYNKRYPSRHMQVINTPQEILSSIPSPTQEAAPNVSVSSGGVVLTSSNSTNSSNSGSIPPQNIQYNKSDNQQVPVLADITFKDLPFYEELDVLIKPTSLIDHGPGRYQETSLPFYLSQRQVQCIYDSRTMQPMQGGNVMSYTFMVQIQVRLCLLETSCEQADHFPAFCSLKVNGSQAFSFQEPQSSNVKRPPSTPIDITGHCRLSSAYPNVLTVTWASNYGQRHCIIARLVRQHNSQVLLDRLKRNVRNVDHSKALIKEKLSCDDNEIATTSLRVSLLCPLSKARIKIPCRSTTCSHLQCFDASIFLQMNERKATWQCPVCDGKAKYDNLAIDALFKEILSQCLETNEIEVFPDGSWKPLVDKKDHMPSTDSKRPEAISVDSPESVTNGGTSKSPVHDVIDILSSDEDEPPPKRPAVIHPAVNNTPKIVDMRQPADIRQMPDPFVDPMSFGGFESLMSLCANKIPGGDAAFNNFIREMQNTRYTMRYQPETSGSGVNAGSGIPGTSSGSGNNSNNKTHIDTDNIITID